MNSLLVRHRPRERTLRELSRFHLAQRAHTGLSLSFCRKMLTKMQPTVRLNLQMKHCRQPFPGTISKYSLPLYSTTYLLVTFENGTFEGVGAGIPRNVAKYLEITAVMRHVENAVDWMIEKLNVLRLIGPVLFLEDVNDYLEVIIRQLLVKTLNIF